MAILHKTKVDNFFKAVSAERYSVSVRQNKVKKNRTDFKVRRKWKVILCQMKAQMIWKQINLSIFLDLPCRLEVVPQKMGHLLTDFWKNSVKKVGQIFFTCLKLTFIIRIWHFTNDLDHWIQWNNLFLYLYENFKLSDIKLSWKVSGNRLFSFLILFVDFKDFFLVLDWLS